MFTNFEDLAYEIISNVNDNNIPIDLVKIVKYYNMSIEKRLKDLMWI